MDWMGSANQMKKEQLLRPANAFHAAGVMDQIGADLKSISKANRRLKIYYASKNMVIHTVYTEIHFRYGNNFI